MGRPKSVEDDEILRVAREVFLKNGVRGTTLDIAEALGVSETLLFKRFKTKRRLFEAAMKAPPFDFQAKLDACLGKGELREELQRVLLQLVDYLREVTPLTMMVWAHPAIDPKDHFQSEGENNTLNILNTLTRHFTEERKLGRLGKCEPEILAQVVLGSLSNFVFHELMGVQQRLPMTAEVYLTKFLTLVLDGVSEKS